MKQDRTVKSRTALRSSSFFRCSAICSHRQKKRVIKKKTSSNLPSPAPPLRPFKSGTQSIWKKKKIPLATYVGFPEAIILGAGRLRVQFQLLQSGRQLGDEYPGRLELLEEVLRGAVHSQVLQRRAAPVQRLSADVARRLKILASPRTPHARFVTVNIKFRINLRCFKAQRRHQLARWDPRRDPRRVAMAADWWAIACDAATALIGDGRGRIQPLIQPIPQPEEWIETTAEAPKFKHRFPPMASSSLSTAISPSLAARWLSVG